jgi:hypothetical protein
MFLPIAVIGRTFLSAGQPTFALLRDTTDCVLASSLPLAAFKSVSPAASYLFCFAKISNQQKATPDRSKARNKINSLRRWGNSAAANVGDLKHSPA